MHVIKIDTSRFKDLSSFEAVTQGARFWLPMAACWSQAGVQAAPKMLTSLGWGLWKLPPLPPPT